MPNLKSSSDQQHLLGMKGVVGGKKVNEKKDEEGDFLCMLGNSISVHN